jgi:MOSC domain-containing protein YiiM
MDCDVFDVCDVCDVCGFRRDLWTDGDLRTTLQGAPQLARQVLDGAPVVLQADLARILAPISDLPTDGVDVPTVHAAMHLLHLAGRLRHAGTATSAGSVVQLSRSGGGVPKLPAARVEMTFGGLDGDRQASRRHHGRPWQAVCLWAAEVVEGLQQDGHPIGFGSAGENVTVRGLDWAALSPGVRLLVGGALLQVTSYAIPCAKNRRWFTDGDVRRMAQQVRPGASRLYASVVVEGVVAPGDAVVVEPVLVPAQAPRAEQLSLSLQGPGPGARPDSQVGTLRHGLGNGLLAVELPGGAHSAVTEHRDGPWAQRVLALFEDRLVTPAGTPPRGR